MALIGKIRQRTGLLLGFIGLAMVLFLLMDALGSRSMFAGSDKQKVGKINGQTISLQEFNTDYTEYQERIRMINPQMVMDEQTSADIVNETWNDYLFRNTAGRHFNALGLTVTPEELAEQFRGKFAHPLVRRMFSNPQTGQFDPKQVQDVMSSMDKIDPSGKLREQIATIEKLVEDDRIKSKYTALISKAFYMPKFMVKYYMQQNGEMATVSFVSVPLSQVADKDIAVSDAEMEAYIKKNPVKYKRKASRSIEYITFNLVPSPEDSARSREKMNELDASLRNAQPNDSAFIQRNAVRRNDLHYFTAEELAGRSISAQLLSSAPGTILGPYIEQNSFVLTKVQGRRIVADSVRAAHILLDNTNPETAKAKADSLIASIRAGKTSFGQAAYDNSTDEASKTMGGDLGYFGKGRMVQQFNDKVFYEMMLGEVKTVESQFGLHIILLIDQKGGQPAVQFADIAVPIQAGTETEKELFRKAREFEQTYNTPAKFAQARKKGYKVLTANGLLAEQVSIPELGPARKVIQWAFQEEKPGVVNYFDESDKFIIAHLTKVTEEGLAPVAEVKTEVAAAVRKEKKGAQLKEKIDKVLSASATLQDLATKLNGIYVDSVSVNFNLDEVDGIGNEPNLVAAAIGLSPGKRSKTVIGNNSVFVVQSKSKGNPNEGMFPEEFFAMQFRQSVLSRLGYESIIKALKENCTVDDKRYMYF